MDYLWCNHDINSISNNMTILRIATLTLVFSGIIIVLSALTIPISDEWVYEPTHWLLSALLPFSGYLHVVAFFTAVGMWFLFEGFYFTYILTLLLVKWIFGHNVGHKGADKNDSK